MTRHRKKQPLGGQWAEQQKKGMQKQQEHKGGEVETETGERLKGPKPIQRSEDKKVLSEGAPGEDRTPDQPIGEVAHADKSEGGAGKPQASNLESEKQGGIGGP